MPASRRKRVADASKPETQRVNLQIDVAAYQRLLLHSIMGKEQPGVIVSRLIDAHCRAWKVAPNAPARAMSTQSVESDDSTSENEHQEAA
jgi:hypothetical protein